MQIETYLERIGYEGDVEIDFKTLAAIHRHHLMAISYENLDVQLQKPVTTSPAEAYEKIVERGRGGWCYEMNGLMQWALSEIGFDIKRVCGGVGRSVRGDSAVGNHLVLLVELDQTYIVDVGFGDGFFEPVPIKSGRFNHRGFEFQLEEQDDGYWRLHNHKNGSAPSFDFCLEPADESLLAEQCRWLQSSEDSPFVMTLVCQRFVEGGYEAQRGRIARSVSKKGVRTKLLDSPEALTSRLKDIFDLEVPGVADLWPVIVSRHDELFGGSS